MLGIVIVSHSKQLALGVRELAAQMVQGQVPLAVAAGVDDPANPLGTDVMQVYEAISSVFSDDGVLVLMDLGSALMSTEMALEFLPPEQREKIYLCAAPLVEGAVAATVAAAAGMNIQEVMAEANGALGAKATQLGLDAHPILVVSSQPITNTEVATREIRLKVSNRLGLHARPSAQFVATASRFQSQIQVQNLTRKTEAVRGDSINQVATLGVRQGHELRITATGVDAQEALQALQALIINNFGEDDRIPELTAPPQEFVAPTHGELAGIAASPGVAIAPLFHYQSASVAITEYHIENVEIEWQRLQSAIQIAKQEIATLLSHTSIQIGDAEAAIFDAHLLFLTDPVLLDAARHHIVEQHLNAEFAWQAVVDEVTNSYRRLEDVYLQERVDDVVDVGSRVLRILLGNAPTDLQLTEPSIIVATDLSPSDTAKLDPAKVMGICMTSGSATSHSAIIARTLGIPAVMGVDAQLLNWENGTLIALDGEIGKAWVAPTEDKLNILIAKRQIWQQAQAKARKLAHKPAITHDGQHIKVFANIGSIADAQAAINHGAEGVGLLRTEFLYLERKNAPGEEEQLEVYQAIVKVLENKPLIIRTLDIGGDKHLPYLSSGVTEANPFLGVRGIRFCLENPQLLKTQLRAILRASVGNSIKIMWPMIATLTELRAARAILEEVQKELRQGGISFDETMKVGMMIETPAAVAIADQLAQEVDFFSIGTNDLSQYVMAGDRTNPRVATLADALQPAVLRMIQQTVQAAHTANIWVGLCGEVAAETIVAPILLGLGVDELSVNPQAIAPLKQVISQITIAEAQALAKVALQQDSATSVRELLYPIG
ncbi:phosphoenolpyruvate--protein phosphotransferase [Anabaena cylindrica FACHB-243]|uniref:Phosphocarrier protein HPr n=1 Tax=Anabaena cylindrica (strain ATCC 27899 / PCC 7122) TaxID=272123 RepID=K9ZBT4_ANACC|nr:MULTISPECIES: phosphoenolpyruvate--protein phosphotransferase [Anabaena]AFZ56663.1 phosphoenolpyruvate-protein phosphotransferase [Anabaena cylindrica PCC 7122]MBD2416166.1 phosphoenolpyruvate--protein phosphotransferase [Anabaena cylindrica FACHB-243]MCM2408647.1 phosphoenolpyruvate--protein phosphotransferase [Anabaena sp. CCAP 1446/1C]BAY00884.1 phosphoenolpyruvate-protein phosphotransferase [Anabaena cylindrica PCC 7122]